MTLVWFLSMEMCWAVVDKARNVLFRAVRGNSWMAENMLTSEERLAAWK